MDFNPKPGNKFDNRDAAREEANKKLNEAFAKFEMNLERIRLENEKNPDKNQFEVNVALAGDILKEDIKKIINDLANNIQ